MIQMLICRLTSCPRHDKATVVLEEVDRRLEIACLIPIHEAYLLTRVLRLARCTCVPVLELIDGLRAVLDGDDARYLPRSMSVRTMARPSFPKTLTAS